MVKDQPFNLSAASREDDETEEMIEQEVMDISGKHKRESSEYLAKYEVFGP